MGEETRLLFDLQGARERPEESPGARSVYRLTRVTPRGGFSFEVCLEAALDGWVPAQPTCTTDLPWWEHRGLMLEQLRRRQPQAAACPACVQLLPSLFHIRDCGCSLTGRTISKSHLQPATERVCLV